MPPSSDHGRLVEALYLAGDEANAAWSAPDVRAGWALQLVGSLFEFPALLALGMRHCHDAGLDLVKTVRAHLDALDDDLFTKSGDARVEVGDLGVALVRRPRPALEITQVVKGTGGRISAGLPMVLEEAVWGWVPFALKLMSGVMPLKTVRLGPGSIANVPALRSKPPRAKLLATLKESGSDIAIRVRLKGKLAIAEGDLAAYRARLAAGMEWIRGNHPAIKATPRLVIE